jgi:4-diphosphocytidyl-2-C-methyl-D-erythritol kinase
VGAGLGGGSSDAARTLLGLDRFWGCGLWGSEPGRQRLGQLAATLGSDVPFFLYGPSSVCRGRGEDVRPTPPPIRARWALLMLPPMAMSTPLVYRRFDEMELGRAMGHVESVAGGPPWKEWSALEARRLLPLLVNDLEVAAFDMNPDLGRLRQEAEKALGRPVRMSGSGSSLFTLFDERPEALAAAERMGSGGSLRAVPAEVSLDLKDDLSGP